LKVNRRFGGTYRLHLQDRRISRASDEHSTTGDMFLWNVGWISTDYIVLYPGRQYSTYYFVWNYKVKCTITLY
jgi:hypothetical protein